MNDAHTVQRKRNTLMSLPGELKHQIIEHVCYEYCLMSTKLKSSKSTSGTNPPTLNQICPIPLVNVNSFKLMNLCKDLLPIFEKYLYTHIKITSFEQFQTFQKILFPNDQNMNPPGLSLTVRNKADKIQSIKLYNITIPLRRIPHHKKDEDMKENEIIIATNEQQTEEQHPDVDWKLDDSLIGFLSKCSRLNALHLVHLDPPEFMTQLIDTGKSTFLPKIKHLYFSPRRAMTNHSQLLDLINACPNLKSLSLHGVFMQNGYKSAQTAFKSFKPSIHTFRFHDCAFASELCTFVAYGLLNQNSSNFVHIFLDNIFDTEQVYSRISSLLSTYPHQGELPGYSVYTGDCL